MIRVVPIVTGHGEDGAVPILLRRIAAAVDATLTLDVQRPLRVMEGKLLKPGELERTVELAGRRAGPLGGVLVLLDCDDDCPATVGPAIQRRAHAGRPDLALEVVLARREFESWFLAGASSLAGKRGLVADLAPPDQPEGIRDAKGWLKRHMTGSRGYSEVVDQPALTAQFDLLQARERSDSFDVCYRHVERLLRRLAAHAQS